MFPLETAFEKLRPYEWELHTCDYGYCCTIYKQERRGVVKAGEEASDNMMVAINGAVEQAQKYERKSRRRKCDPQKKTK